MVISKQTHNHMKKTFLFLGILFFVVTTSAQEKGILVYGNTASSFGLEYQFNKMFAVGIRVDQGNLDGQSITPLLIAVIKETADASVYAGLGLNGLDPADNISIPLGVRVFPFSERRLAFSIELESVIGDDYYVSPSIGIVYRFIK